MPVGVLNSNGCCHLETELNYLCAEKTSFLARAAVTRTRQCAQTEMIPKSGRYRLLSLFSVEVSQRFVDFTGYP